MHTGIGWINLCMNKLVLTACFCSAVLLCLSLNDRSVIWLLVIFEGHIPAL